MRSTVLFLGLAGALAMSASSAHAVLVAYEGFDYAAGTDLKAITTGSGGSGWTSGYLPRHMDDSATGAVVASGGLSYGALPVVGNAMTNTQSPVNPVRWFVDPYDVNEPPTYYGSYPSMGIQSGTVYVSALVNVTTASDAYLRLSCTPLNGDGEFAAFGLHRNGDGTVATSASTGGSTVGAADKTTGTTYLLVARVDLDAKTLAVYNVTDPAAGLPGTADVTTSFTNFPTNAWFNAPGTTNGFGGVVFGIDGGTGTLDEVRIGTTVADVIPVPEPASLSLLGLGGLTLLARRRK